MTLGELLDLGILRENAVIAQCVEQQHKCNAGKTCDGCSCLHNKPLVNITRNYNVITRDIVIKRGGETYLDKEVVDVFGFRENKLGILIRL